MVCKVLHGDYTIMQFTKKMKSREKYSFLVIDVDNTLYTEK